MEFVTREMPHTRRLNNAWACRGVETLICPFPTQAWCILSSMVRVVSGLLIAVCAGSCLERSAPCACEPDVGDSVAPTGLVEWHPTIQVARFSQPTVDWWHVVPAAGDNRLLIVVVNTDAPSTHPVSVTADGVVLALFATQAAPNYGALSLWALVDPVTGGTHIEVTFTADPVWGFAQSVSFQGVDPNLPFGGIAGGPHSGPGPFTQVLTTPVGDVPMLVVSWGNNQATDWLGAELELWDVEGPGGGSALGGAAATFVAADSETVSFSWDDNPGAHLGFNVQAAR